MPPPPCPRLASILMELFYSLLFVVVVVPIVCRFCIRSLCCGGVVLNVLSGFTIILLKHIEN